ncbi:unnamed protein product [Prunus armeniaca]|uniref:Uncharacterized protein n=1 Tax=Prunus armeniaca TaxID=36596 RepID=A0A6J5XR55_PRUAR|nr:unnamed protein product [Prunus armeniaca]
MGKLANHQCSQTTPLAGEILVGQLCTEHNRAGGWVNLGRTTVCRAQVHANIQRQLGMVKLANDLCSQIQEVAGQLEREHGQPPVQSHRQVVGEMLVGQQCTRHSQIGQMARKILVGQLCTKHRYEQIFEGNRERGNWPTTYAVKSGRWLLK